MPRLKWTRAGKARTETLIEAEWNNLIVDNSGNPYFRRLSIKAVKSSAVPLIHGKGFTRFCSLWRYLRRSVVIVSLSFLP